jgi:hypothetical protein
LAIETKPFNQKNHFGLSRVILLFTFAIEIYNEGEFVIIPHLLEHKPEVPEEVEIVLIEPKQAVNTANVETDKIVKKQDKI